MPAYSYSTNEEDFYGFYATAEEARTNGFDNDPDADIIYVGENIKFTAHDFISAQNILEEILESACDECGENAEDWLDDLLKNKDKKAELTKLIGDWLEANAKVNFWAVKNISEFNRYE